jgi:tetratricopeptide (TPR) repeat protein
MFTKEITITLPLAVLLYDFCFLRTEEKFNWKYLGPFLLLLAIIPITVMKAKIQAPGVDSALEPGVVVPSAREYLLTEFRVIVTYIRLLFVPLHQNLDYDYPISYSLWNFPTLASLFLLTTIVGTAVKIFKSYRMPAFGIFWFFLTLIPESSVMPIYDVIFEHRLYLAMFGFAIVFVSGMYYFLGKRRPQAALVLALLILFAYGVLSIRRNAIWNNTLALWDDTLKKSPHKVRPHNNRGNAYADLGDYKKAIDDYNAALKLNPFHANSYFNRGLAFYRLKKYDAAIIDYGQAIMINPACTAAFNNRGSVYFVQGDYTSAIADYQEALRINPGYKDAYDNLAMASQAMVQSAQSSRAPADFYAQAQSLVLSGEYDKAIEAYTQAIKVNPKNAQAYNNRGAVFALKGWYDKAIADYTQALAIQPSFKDAQANLAAALAEQGQQDSGRKK